MEGADGAIALFGDENKLAKGMRWSLIVLHEVPVQLPGRAPVRELP